MRKLMLIASVVVLSSVVGCSTTGTGCSSCGSGGSGCGSGGSACGSGCGGAGSGSWWAHRPCTVGVCDCDIPPLAPYGAGLGLAAHQAPAPAHAAAQPVEAPHEMPKVAADNTDKDK